ncbi:uncharacterized protein LOC123554061 [Mercenaria mercenaria]|uniref:uncharacterized protein LOC123554061 n=1 Tax=Mercenaria mercenaria TaxID=6596 RepID=UPI00234F0CBC|nr:uncharacterized protein LOC123554061 [Mercenaria mercenaria]XP_045199870.2 uncharacterized protein LOC123554061 [Mercenaria mercenaria]
MDEESRNEDMSSAKKDKSVPKEKPTTDLKAEAGACGGYEGESEKEDKKRKGYSRRRHQSEAESAQRDKNTDQSLGARPKEIKSGTYYNRRYARKGSFDSRMPTGCNQNETKYQRDKCVYVKYDKKHVEKSHTDLKDKHADSYKGNAKSGEDKTQKIKFKDTRSQRNKENTPRYVKQKCFDTYSSKGELHKTTAGHIDNWSKGDKRKNTKANIQTSVESDDRKNANVQKKQISSKVDNQVGTEQRFENGGKTFQSKGPLNPSASHKHLAKETYLYVVVNDKVRNTSNLKNFLLHRMGNPKALDFEVTDTCGIRKSDSESSIISVKFESFNKASVARHMLNRNNKNAEHKIQCFFDKREAEGLEVDTTKQKKDDLERAFIKIVELAKNGLDKHNDKIRDVRASLSVVEERIGKKRGVSFYEFEKLSNEKLAFEDKLEELEGQRKEFTRYLQSMKLKLNTLIDCDKFEHELKEIRKAFGVECQRLAAALPMYARREDILTIIKDNQVCVILGETGSGKSTQMVQYIYQAGFAADGLIACTQPRKIAAVSLAIHVSSELASSVGQVVGYKVGMQTKMTAVTKVVFMTDHILLNECLKDRMLTQYSCILIDEAHERSIHTDLLLGMLKEALNSRPDLRVVITSATIDPDIFVDYFGGYDHCPVLKVSGRTFPVDVFWEQDDYFDTPFPEDYERKALNKAIEIHQSEKTEGDILVFLTAAVETDRCTEKLKKMIGEADVQCLQLHGRLKTEEQQLVFEKTPRGKRKIVFATNSAETSITIPGIKFVVDTGVVKEMRFDPKKNMNSLDVVSVSQSSANQRKGRAGRTSSGICYRLYTLEDYKRMDRAASPEILRIQVSQAMLKLMELGVDPISFDYVQSPSQAAMISALDELKEIGAVDDAGISELGKWIAKLPVEPKLGAFIKKGVEMEITTEALVVASCCNQSGIFFRVGTQEEKKEADARKMKFCHLGGDLLTMLNVYREWDKVQERAKGKWCQTNSINGKAMKGVRDMMNEMITVLKKELELKIKHEFKDPQEADSRVQNLIFECMTSKLGYYLGHESAGYLIVNRLQRVQLHPSSAVLSLGFEPSWVVFNRVLKTSADFMTEVTPVLDDVVEDAIQKGKVCIDMELLMSLKVKRVLKMPVGKHVFWKFVGPMHKNRRKVEEDIRMACDGSLIIVEADKQRGEISVFCTVEHEDQASAMLRSILEAAPQQLLNESREEPIGNDKSSVRAVLREGGSAVDILMPNDYRVLNIKQKDNSMYDLDEESVRTMLEEYGPVEQIWQTTGKKQSQSPFWGKVTFTHKLDAEDAVEDINKDDECEIRLIPISHESQTSAPQQGFTMKLTWCRRPGKGHCFVYLDRPEDMSQLLLTPPMINGTYVQVSLSKQQSDLFIKGLSRDVTEDEVKDGLARVIGLSLDECRDRFRVIIARHIAPWSVDQRFHVQDELATIMSRYTQRDSFRVHVREYKQQTVMCIAFASFSDPQVCYDTANAMTDDGTDIDGHPIDITLECKATVHVNRKLYNIVGQDVKRLVDRYVHKNSSTTLKIRDLKSGNFSVDIKAITPQKLAKVKVQVETVVGGDTLECGEKENMQSFFTKDGRQQAQRIEKATRTLIFVDERQMKISIQGLALDRVQAIQMIDDYISKNANAMESEVRLKGEENPPGLLKALLVKYGLRFDDLKKDTGISKVFFNLRSHEITLTGKEEDIKKAQDKIKEIRAELTAREKVQIQEAELPDCPICLCPVEESDMCRLEYCGHAYCKVCLASQIQAAVSDRQLPVVCAVEDCNKALVIRDINTQIKIGNIKRKALLDAAVASLVVKNSEEFHYCITPDCEVVYRVTTNGELFYCPACRTKICTSCHSQSHEGLTCAMYKSAKRDGESIVKWLRVDPTNRKLCPKCGIGIEKSAGCDHMECKCGAHICWKCLEYFSSSGGCYGHLSRAHDSFV